MDALQKKTTRGFSLLETVAAALVLGVGTLAITRSFTVSQQELSWTRSHAIARNLMRQRLADFSTKPVEELPACAGVPGCRLSRTEMASELGVVGSFACTQYSDGRTILPDSGASTSEGLFRIDTLVEDHPEIARFPTGHLLTVSVCWRDQHGAIQEVRSRQVVLSDD
ncbi:MAG: hypothetical protein IPK13_24430 [Deltaproteobacteria bacterium]|nr:hypothetical protein [Deltaproteobacteria bacterium]